MTDEKTLVYRFPNATLVKFVGTSYHGAVLTDGTDEVLKVEDSPISKEVADKLYGVQFYGPAVGELKIEQVRTVEAVDRYVARDWKAGLRDLSADDYEKLSDNFKKLYKKELAEPQELRNAIDHDTVKVSVELSDGILMGSEFLSDLHGQVNKIRESAKRSNSYGSKDPRPELWRALPLELSTKDLVGVMHGLNSRIAQGHAGHGYQASVVFRGGYTHTPDFFDIDYYAQPYRGETRKLLDKKQNGQPYADRRGRMVKDLPRVVGNASISEQDIAAWWSSFEGDTLSDTEKLEVISEFINHLWRFEKQS